MGDNTTGVPEFRFLSRWLSAREPFVQRLRFDNTQEYGRQNLLLVASKLHSKDSLIAQRYSYNCMKSPFERGYMIDLKKDCSDTRYRPTVRIHAG